jgi:hypothetical protein
MAVIAQRELPREGTWAFGESPDLTRRFVLTVDRPGTTTPLQCAVAVNIDIGRGHPDYPTLPCTNVSINEHYDESPYHVEFIAQYTLPEAAVDNPNPLLRPPVWKFETSGQAVPALFYYDNSNAKQPLTNSAFDFFEGLTTDEAYTRVTIQANLVSFPSGLATAATNRINASGYLFGNPHTWKCQGITGEYKRELVGSTVVAYWQATSVLMFRMSGWDLQLPDMGFNALVGGQKRRVMTFDFENSEWIPSPVPLGLNGSGAQTFGAPAILVRRVYEEANFSQLFGAPPA